jgi:hypothetical protein
MGTTNFQVVWEVTEEFCPRLIVTDRVILDISTVITSERTCDGEQFQSLVIEHGLVLDGIEGKGF